MRTFSLKCACAWVVLALFLSAAKCGSESSSESSEPSEVSGDQTEQPADDMLNKDSAEPAGTENGGTETEEY